MRIPALVNETEVSANYLAFDALGRRPYSMYELSGSPGWPLQMGTSFRPLKVWVWRIDVTATDGRTWSGSVTIEPDVTTELVLE